MWGREVGCVKGRLGRGSGANGKFLRARPQADNFAGICASRHRQQTHAGWGLMEGGHDSLRRVGSATSRKKKGVAPAPFISCHYSPAGHGQSGGWALPRCHCQSTGRPRSPPWPSQASKRGKGAAPPKVDYHQSLLCRHAWERRCPKLRRARLGEIHARLSKAYFSLDTTCALRRMTCPAITGTTAESPKAYASGTVHSSSRISTALPGRRCALGGRP